MKISFRWYGPDDPVSLEHIRQIPGLTTIVTALHDIPTGEVWPLQSILDRKNIIEDAGLEFGVVESLNVHEDIKLGRPTRDALIDTYCEGVRNLGEAGIPVLCYNFMAVFDWTRTDLSMGMSDGSTALAYSQEDMENLDLREGTGSLPGWGDAYSSDQLKELLKAYESITSEDMWDNLTYFLERVVPVAEESRVRMAIHPDDPPWSVFGLPRIVTSGEAFERIVGIVNSRANGVTLCTGSLGANPDNDLVDVIDAVGHRINFAHFRNVSWTGDRTFNESPHPSRFGSLDMNSVVAALIDVGFEGPIRPDHGRMIWGETGNPGYGLYDRALGAAYLQGLIEANG